jgi:hypothetical protein
MQEDRQSKKRVKGVEGGVRGLFKDIFPKVPRRTEENQD